MVTWPQAPRALTIIGEAKTLLLLLTEEKNVNLEIVGNKGKSPEWLFGGHLTLRYLK